MIITIIVSILIFLLLTLSIMFFPYVKVGRVKIGTYWVVALVGATLLLLCGCVPLDVVYQNLTVNTEINPIKILVLFISMTFLSIVLDELGLFRWASVKAVKIACSNQLSIFLSLYFLSAILTIFTSNDIVILTLTPFICFLCKNIKVNPIPYLIGEFMAANTYSMMLIIGNPTNIYLATSAGIVFLDYVKVMALPTIGAGIVEVLLILLVFHKPLSQKIEKVYEDVKIKDKVEAIIAVLHLLVCLVFLVMSSYLHIEMWLISCICALSLLIILAFCKLVRKNHDDTLYKSFFRLPFELIPFVLSMFVVIITLDYENIISKAVSILGDGHTIFTYGISSYLVSNVINNIPMSMLYSHLISFLDGSLTLKATYASIVGSNIGAFLTPIGALAGIMFTTLTDKYGTKLNFKTFIKYGVLISIPVLMTTLFILSLIL